MSLSPRSSAGIIDVTAFSSRRRNYMLQSHRKDGLIEWMKSILYHSFVLDASSTYFETMSYFEDLIEEHRVKKSLSRLQQYVPSVGIFHTSLPLREAFQMYDAKYRVTCRRYVSPSFNEIRHTLNLAQVMAIGPTMSMISFDGDQTLYTDGANFGKDEELSSGIIALLLSGVRVCVVTAAGYGLDGPKYESRLRGLLDSFVERNLTNEIVNNFYVCGGECNYLLKCCMQAAAHEDGKNPASSFTAVLIPVLYEEWQAESLGGPRPAYWTPEQINQVLDIAEESMKQTLGDLKLRAKLLRKERAVGIYPGGEEMVKAVPIGHGSKKLKREALDELVLRVVDALRIADPPIEIPYCVFNGGGDAWVDIGSKSVGVEALQAYFGLLPSQCLHVGDQFLQTGNDFSARETCPCIWITSPKETAKILQHILRFKYA